MLLKVRVYSWRKSINYTAISVFSFIRYIHYPQRQKETPKQIVFYTYYSIQLIQLSLHSMVPLVPPAVLPQPNT